MIHVNLNWLTSPVAIYGAVAAMGWAALRLVVGCKLDLTREQQRMAAETEDLRATVKALEATVAELQADARERAAAVSYSTPHALNLHKRSDALRMYRRGSDQSSVAAAVGMPHAQVALLEKVYRILDGQNAPHN